MTLCGTGSHWGEEVIRVTMRQGLNVIALETTGQSGVIVDSLEVRDRAGLFLRIISISPSF